MDFFEEKILAALKDSKRKDFSALLEEVGFSHNTLQQHLERLTANGLVAREKVSAKGFGRPKFAYYIPLPGAQSRSMPPWRIRRWSLWLSPSAV
jgi:predicted ArsR family transcriptional regulator